MSIKKEIELISKNNRRCQVDNAKRLNKDYQDFKYNRYLRKLDKKYLKKEDE
jgi:hypothetical protein